jgi:hypothetical protein
MKTTPKIRKEFEYLESIGRDSDFIEEAMKTPMKTSGVSAVEAWGQITSHGKTVDCKEPAALDRARSGKKVINLTIKMWATDLVDCLLTLDCVLSMTHDAPAWVYKATVRQSHKLAMAKYLVNGKTYIPTRLQPTPTR